MSSDKNQSDKLSSARYSILIGLGLIITTLFIYWPVYDYDFIGFDDDEYVFENHQVKDGFTTNNIKWAFTKIHMANWHPLTWLSHILDCQLFGLNPGGHHLTSLLFHIANTILLFIVFKKLTGCLWQSGFVAALFALHPLHIESVAWVSERKDVLCAFFWMLTLLSYAGYVKRPGVKRYLPVLLFFTLGLMSKPMIVTLPCVLLLLDYWPLNRIQTVHSSTKTGKLTQEKIFRLVNEKLPLFILVAMLSVITFWGQKQAGAVVALNDIPFHTRIANALISFAAYMMKMFYPVNMTILYPQQEIIPSWKIAGSLAILLTISYLAFRYRKQKPYFIIGWLWYLGTLVPVIGLIQVGSQSMADRYTYIPLIGLFIMIAWGATDLSKKWGINKKWIMLSGCIVIMALMAVSMKQILYWKNSIALFEHTLSITSDNPIIHNNLATALNEKGYPKEAITHYLQAIQINPNYVAPYYNLAKLYEKLDRQDEAIYYYSQILKIDPAIAETENNLGNALSQQNQIEEAITHYKQAIKIKPDFAEAHVNLGNALNKQGRTDEAITHFIQALKIKPDLSEALYNMGLSLAARQRFTEAIDVFKKSLAADPNRADAHYQLGISLLKTGQMPEAQYHFEKTIYLSPNHVDAYINLGNVFSQTGIYSKAIDSYRHALQIAPGNASAHNNLGNTYARMGDMIKAIEEYAIILQINPDFTNAKMNLNNVLSVWVDRSNPQEIAPELKRLADQYPHVTLFEHYLEKAGK